MIKSFKKFYTQSSDINSVQENVEDFANQLVKNNLLDGQILNNISLLASVDNKIPHKLSRKPLGYLVIRKSADANIYDDQDNNSMEHLTLLLKTNVNCIVSLYVF